MAELVHHGTLMFLVEEHVAKAPDRQLFVAGFLKATKGTAFAAERPRVVVEGAEYREVVLLGEICEAHSILIVDESELWT